MLPNVGDCFLIPPQEFTVLEILGKGGFGTVFSVDVKSGRVSRQWAMKCEEINPKNKSLKREASVLKSLRDFPSPNFFRASSIYVYEAAFRFMLMPVLGKNLEYLRQRMPDRRFSWSTIFQIADQTLSAIEHLHKLDYYHSDVKPANFLVGNQNHQHRHFIFLSDFGMTKKLSDVSKALGGTLRYQSRTAQTQGNVGAVDDLESWLFSMVKLAAGKLPWKDIARNQRVEMFKSKCRSFSQQQAKKEFLQNSPPVFGEFMNYIDTLDAKSKVDYRYLQFRMCEFRVDNGMSIVTPPDWDPERRYSGPIYSV